MEIARVPPGYSSVHGAALFNRKSYGPVRCGFKKAEILRWGSVRFSDIVNPTVRFGAVIYPTVRFGAVLKNRKSYGAVRFGFSKIVNDTVRFGAVFRNQEPYGAVFRYSKSYGAVRCCDKSYGAVRCGSPLNGFCYGAGPIPVGKIVRNRFFFTVHRMNKPTKPRFRRVSDAFSRGTNPLAKPLQAAMNKPYKPACSYGFRARCIFTFHAKSREQQP